jgi:predicted DNA binding CopG/RHH family protein
MKKKLPEFKSEEAERKFWATADSTQYVDWASGEGKKLVHLKPSLKTISLRLPVSMIEDLKVLANRRDVPYLPKFHSDKEAAEYFETHSVADVWDQLPAGKQVKPSAALAESIRERHAGAKSPISIRLVPEQILAAKKIAAAKSVGYQTQLRMWIAEGIRREAKREE